MTNEVLFLDRVCVNCNNSHPSEPYSSDYAICLRDPEFEPYLDDILEDQDFSRCLDLARRKRFAWDRDACEHFNPVEDLPDGEELSELGREISELAESGKLTKESIELAFLREQVRQTDWSTKSVDNELQRLAQAKSPGGLEKALGSFGFLVGEGNRAAFDGLCGYLRELPPPSDVAEKELRIEILRQVSMTRDPAWKSELALLLVDDLCRVPSNQTTRGWYTAVFAYFERRCPTGIAEDALSRMLDSPQFSYRIKRRVRDILARYAEDEDDF